MFYLMNSQYNMAMQCKLETEVARLQNLSIENQKDFIKISDICLKGDNMMRVQTQELEGVKSELQEQIEYSSQLEEENKALTHELEKYKKVTTDLFYLYGKQKYEQA